MKSFARQMLPYAVMAATVAIATAVMIDSPERGIPGLYKGMMVWSFGWAFLDAYTIGANDVANAFANAVGSNTITHRQACIIACFGEFLGVMVLGSTVTDTVRKKMIQFDWFVHDPYVFALGMSCVNLGSGLWVMAATVLGMPVSTTHAVVGAILGVGVAAWGPNGVRWDYPDGFLGVVASWFVSPAVSGVLGAFFYLLVKYTVLNYPDEQALRRGILLLPFYFFASFGIVAAFMFLKGAPSAKDWSLDQSVGATFAVAIFFGLFALIFVVPWTRRTIQGNENLPWYTMMYHWAIPVGKMGYIESTDEKEAEKGAEIKTKELEMEGSDKGSGSELAFRNLAAPSTASAPNAHLPVAPSLQQQQHGQQYMQVPYGAQMGMMPPMYGQTAVYGMGQGFGATNSVQSTVLIGQGFGLEPVEILEDDPWYTKMGKNLAPGFYMDVGALRDEDAAMHATAFQAYPKTEEMFKMIQLTTCIFFSISHGANDIANALAPLASVWLVYDSGELAKKAPIPYWLLAYGGFALDIGLIMSGHHIMSCLGNRLTLQSPSRGFCIELGAMMTVMVFSRGGFPVSTTHCMTGATTGVGLCNGNLKAVNWKLMAVIMGGWLVTCPAAGIVTGLVFWGIASAPSPMAGNGFFGGHYSA